MILKVKGEIYSVYERKTVVPNKIHECFSLYKYNDYKMEYAEKQGFLRHTFDIEIAEENYEKQIASFITSLDTKHLYVKLLVGESFTYTRAIGNPDDYK